MQVHSNRHISTTHRALTQRGLRRMKQEAVWATTLQREHVLVERRSFGILDPVNVTTVSKERELGLSEQVRIGTDHAKREAEFERNGILDLLDLLVGKHGADSLDIVFEVRDLGTSYDGEDVRVLREDVRKSNTGDAESAVLLSDLLKSSRDVLLLLLSELPSTTTKRSLGLLPLRHLFLRFKNGLGQAPPKGPMPYRTP